MPKSIDFPFAGHLWRCARVLIVILCALATPGWSAELKIRLLTPPPEGTVVFMLYNAADNFGDLRGAFQTLSLPADGREHYTIPELPAGDYALLVYHDSNANGRLDKNFIGIPKEPVGFSNRYKPKGPPSFNRARFTLAEGDTLLLEIELSRPFAKRGQLGLGLAAIARSSPYRGAGSGDLLVFPALTYVGERVQLFGPTLRVGLFDLGNLHSAATLTYRPGAYDEDDSPLLDGLGDREDTLLAGVAVESKLPAGLNLGLRYAHDALDRIGGGTARLQLSRAFVFGSVRLTPQLAMNRLEARLANHDYGVPADQATSTRPAYRLKAIYNAEAGVNTMIEITPEWRLIVDLSAERLDDEAAASPIVSERIILRSFAALTYAL